MSRKLWTPEELSTLRNLLATKLSLAEVAGRLNRPIASVKTRIHRMGLARRLPWSEADLFYLRENYRCIPTGDIARHLGREVGAVYRAASSGGLTGPRAVIDDALLARIRELNTRGLSDREVAEAIACERHTVAKHRKKFGLPDHSRGERYRAKVRENTRRQCEAAGVPNLGQLRSLAYRQFASRRGWPEDVRPRGVLILEALYRNGPMTRPAIAEAIGMPWRGGRRSLKSNGKGGSYLAELMRLDLVVCFRRAKRGEGRGKSLDLYSLNLNVEPEFNEQCTA